MSEAAAHTAEHLFAGALSRMGQGLSVHRVELGGANAVYLAVESLNWERILEAELMVNDAIAKAIPIRIHVFDDLESAREKFPALRSRDERIGGEVRIVEIEGYDCAACTGDHVPNTAECSYFLVSGLSRSGGYLKVEFLVGEGARRRALEMCKMCHKAAEALGVSVEKLEGAVESLKLEAHALRGRLRDATDEALRRIAPEELADYRVYSACLKGVDERVVMERAGDMIERDPRVAVVFGIDNKSLLIVLARGASLSLDCRAALKDALGSRGFRGGGKPNFANGTVSSGTCDEVVSAVVELVRHLSSR